MATAETLFISDLHLSPERPAITQLFLEFLRRRARQAQALYILGDLFEYWLGDETTEHPAVRPIVAALHELTAAGVPVGVLHGNRDFLLGAGFEGKTGCRVLADPARIDLFGKTVLISHGDQMCTDDVDYMKLRAIVRNLAWQREFLAKPMAEREAMARSLRDYSKGATAQKAAEIMDVNQGAVESFMRAHGARDLIHGHTHRPGDHRFTLDGQSARRVVLGDWYEQGSVLTCTAEGWELKTLPLAA
jgi:UDP-2,3-diacylglucosamine hydrolase